MDGPLDPSFLAATGEGANPSSLLLRCRRRCHRFCLVTSSLVLVGIGKLAMATVTVGGRLFGAHIAAAELLRFS